jgi:hypothetical protein
VLQKRNGKNVLLNSVGSSCDHNEVLDLVVQGKAWISKQLGAELGFNNSEALFSSFINNIWVNQFLWGLSK